MSSKASSNRWKQRQARDPYVRQAQTGGWRSRAVFKLMELDQRDRLLRRGLSVLDLGAAPGGWSQLAAQRTAPGGRVVAVDLLAMEPIEGVDFIRGDFGDPLVQQEVRALLGPAGADLVMSDMAPNMSGNRSVDQPRAMALSETVVADTQHFLRPGGNLVIKLFQGEGFEELVAAARVQFETVRVRKPASSRSESREMYLVAGKQRL